MKEMVGGCCVCSDERGWDENPLVYCDGQGCNVAVHQACYGIVQVPSGPWFCRKCESQERAARVVNNKDIRCELCPCRDGALKKTDQNGWAHVVCALYIPEVRFFNVTTMEPIQTSLIPPERFHKTCFICEENNRGSKASFGACMQCNKQGCKQNFHVTCAQLLGLLCEEAGNMMDNVKYCGYCQYHYSKLKKTSNMKIIPPFRPVPTSHPSDSPSSSPEKGSGQQKSSNSIDDIKGAANSSSTTITAVNPNFDKNHGDNDIKGGSGSNISPDINQPSSSKNAKTSKKGHSSGGKTGASNLPDNSKSAIPRISIAPSSLFASSSFMNKHSGVSGNNKDSISAEEGKAEILKPKSHIKADDMIDSSPVKNDDSLKQDKAEVVSMKEGFIQKKDFSTLQLKEVVTSALDRPSTNSAGAKFEHSSGSLASIESSMSTRFTSLNDKPPPPDIKPHVTLTPIPMRTSTTRLSASREEAEEREREREKSAKSKSPVTSLNFSNTFGQPPKLQNQNASPDMTEITLSKGKGPPDLSLQADLPIPSSDKSAPPAKRSRVEIEAIEDFGDNSEGAVENWPGRGEEEEIPFTRSGNRRESFPHQASQSQSVSPSHSSTGGGRSFSQAQDMWESSSKNKFTVDLELGEELKPLKRGPGRPPRRTGPSREDDRERERKTPGKGRGGRRGGATTSNSNSFNRRETRESTNAANNSMSNGSFVDENSFDDPMEGSPVQGAGSGRGGRQSSLGRKTVGGRSSRQEDPPAPTLAQLRQQAGNQEPVGGSLPAHMFGNALNPASSMAQRMVDTLSQEIEAAAVSAPEVISPQSQLVGIPFPGKTVQGGLSLPSSSSSSAPSNSSSTSNGTVAVAVPVRSSTTSVVENPTSTLNGVTTSGPPPTLEQLLERQWEQGSQFLMEQAQHLDIAQLLSCLNQLKQDNRALEEHVASLSQRRDQLTAVNARLSAPLGSSSTLMSAGAGFNPPIKSQNGQGTPPPNVQHGKGSSMHVQAPLPSPQHQEMIMQSRIREQGQYPHSNESGGNTRGNSELSMIHSTHSPHGHPHGHGLHNHRAQPFGTFSAHNSSSHGPVAVPVVTSHLSHHQLPRDSR